VLVSQASPIQYPCAVTESDRRCGTEWGWPTRLVLCMPWLPTLRCIHTLLQKQQCVCL